MVLPEIVRANLFDKTTAQLLEAREGDIHKALSNEATKLGRHL